MFAEAGKSLGCMSRRLGELSCPPGLKHTTSPARQGVADRARKLDLQTTPLWCYFKFSNPRFALEVCLLPTCEERALGLLLTCPRCCPSVNLSSPCPCVVQSSDFWAVRTAQAALTSGPPGLSSPSQCLNPCLCCPGTLWARLAERQLQELCTVVGPHSLHSAGMQSSTSWAELGNGEASHACV